MPLLDQSIHSGVVGRPNFGVVGRVGSERDRRGFTITYNLNERCFIIN